MRPFKSSKSKTKRQPKPKKTQEMTRFDGATPFKDGEKDYDENPVRKDKMPTREQEGRFGGATTEEV